VTSDIISAFPVTAAISFTHVLIPVALCYSFCDYLATSTCLDSFGDG